MQHVNASNSKEMTADEHAALILETRNSALRVLYDTVVEVEGASEEEVFRVLCRNLLRICNARGAILCRCDAVARTLTPRAVSLANQDDDAIAVRGERRSVAAPPDTRAESLRRPIRPLSEERSSIHDIPRVVGIGAAWTQADVSSTYLLSCIHEGEPIALGFVWLESGAQLKLKDIIKTYLNLMGIVLQRINAVHALRESEAFVKSILDSMGVGVMVVDPDTHKILDINLAGLKLVGSQRDKLIGRRCFGLICGAREGQCPITDLGQSTDMSQRSLRTIEGEEIVVLKSVVPVKRGSREYLIETFTDIRDRLRAEEELQLAKKIAEDANRSKSEFLANMSHEIRTPMTAILGFTDTLLDKDMSDEDRNAKVQIIKRNSEHLLEIINDILDISKLEAGKLDIERIACSPAALIAEACSFMQIRADKKGLTLKVDYQDPLPQTIHTDPTRLKQILVNLLGNAVKFTEKGEVRMAVRLVTESDRARGGWHSPPMLRIDVIDTGIGLSPEQIAKLFRPFVQADTSTTRQFGGTGLGLTITKRLVNLLGGDIAVTSRPGEGSTFSISLGVGPLDNVKMIDANLVANQLSAKIPAFRETTHENALEGVRILLAEDGPDNQRLLGYILHKVGAEVSIVDNGKLAVEAALLNSRAGRSFDLILMDMQMPEMDGYEATRILRSRGCSSPILALTAHAMSQDRDKCLMAGCTDYHTKPINREKLIDTITRCLTVTADQ